MEETQPVSKAESLSLKVEDDRLPFAAAVESVPEQIPEGLLQPGAISSAWYSAGRIRLQAVIDQHAVGLYLKRKLFKDWINDIPFQIPDLTSRFHWTTPSLESPHAMQGSHFSLFRQSPIRSMISLSPDRFRI